MNIRLLIFIFLLVGASVHAQKDLIVTQAGQVIRCKILEESSMRFNYAYINDKGKVSKTEIFKTLISSYKYNYYPEDLLPNEKIFNQPLKTVAVNTGSAESKKVKSKTEETVSKSETAALEKKSRENTDSGADKPLIAENKDRILKNEVEQDSKVKDQPVVSKNKSTQPEEVSADKNIEKEVVAEEIKSDVASKEKEVVDEAIREKEKKSEFKNYLKYRVGFKGGLGNIMEENFNKTNYGLFKERLLRGWIYGVDGAVFLNDNVGVGVTYNSYQSSNKASRLDMPFNNEQGSRTYDEVFTKVNHKFVGPTLLYRALLDYKTFIVASASPGYIFYTENTTTEIMGYRDNYKYKGNTWGAAATLGIDFLIGDDNFGRDVILSFELGYTYGKLKISNELSPINLQRLDFSVGLRFNRFPRYLK